MRFSTKRQPAEPLLTRVAGSLRRLASRKTRALRAAIVVLGMTGALVAATAGPASASVIAMSDSFEGPDAFVNWHFTHTGTGVGGFSSLQTRTGTRDAFLAMQSEGFSSVGRTVHLTHPQHCVAAIWVNPASSYQLVNFEIIEPTSFTYVALKSMTLSPSAPYTQFGVEWFNGPADVLVRVSLIGNGPGTTVSAWVDDLGINCFY
jgi:hypothetical protein